MDDLCNIKINTANIGCDTSTREPVTLMVERLPNGVLILHNADALDLGLVKAITAEFNRAMEAGELAAVPVIEAPEIPEVHIAMQPHTHRNDALPYLTRNKSKYIVPKFNGKHAHHSQKHHQRKTGRR